ARNLAALADLDLHVVHDRADRHVSDRHGVAGFHVRVLAGDDDVALGEPLWRQDVGELAILVLDQCDEGGAVGIIFDPLDLGRDIEFATLEIDLAVGPLMTAATKPYGDAAAVVAPATCILALGQRLYRCAPMQTGAIHPHDLPPTPRHPV